MKDSLSAQSGIFWQESASLPAGRQGNCILAVATRSLERNNENANRSRRQKIPCAKKLLLLLRKSIDRSRLPNRYANFWRYAPKIRSQVTG